MSEWISTGTMVDTLKVGEEAECSIGNDIVVVKSETGQILVKTANDITYPLTLDFKTDKAQWRILPKYVSFDEAMKARKEGKGVTFHRNRGTVYMSPGSKLKLKDGFIGEFTLDELVNGEWTVRR